MELLLNEGNGAPRCRRVETRRRAGYKVEGRIWSVGLVFATCAVQHHLRQISLMLQFTSRSAAAKEMFLFGKKWEWQERSLIRSYAATDPGAHLDNIMTIEII